MDKRDFMLAKISVGGLLLSTAVLVVAGVLSLFGELIGPLAPYLKGACILGFAGIAGFALAVAQAAASCAQVLDGDKYAGARGVAYVCAAITGAVSLAGVYLGDAVLNGHPVTLPPLEVMLCAGFLLAFIKPAMTFVITACETKERGRIDATDAIVQAKDARIATLERELRDLTRRLGASESAASEPSQPTNVEVLDKRRPRGGKGLGTAVAATAAALTPLAATAHEAQPAAIVQAAERAPEARQPALEEIEDARYQLNLRGVRPSLRTVAAHLNVRKCDIEAVWPKGVPLAFAETSAA